MGTWMILTGGNHQHVVDGGYYENSGIIGAVEWLDDAFGEFVKNGGKLPGEVLFLELNAFPHGTELDETQPAPATAQPNTQAPNLLRS